MSKTAIIVFSLALLCAAGVVCLGSARKNQKGFKSLTNKEFEKAIKSKDVRLIDVRTAEEYAQGHIPGAINIDVNSPDFAERCLKVLRREETAAVYCRSGRRSKNAATILSAKWASIIELNGGFLSWTSDIEK